jgi:hypothetical protein
MPSPVIQVQCSTVETPARAVLDALGAVRVGGDGQFMTAGLVDHDAQFLDVELGLPHRGAALGGAATGRHDLHQVRSLRGNGVDGRTEGLVAAARRVHLAAEEPTVAARSRQGRRRTEDARAEDVPVPHPFPQLHGESATIADVAHGGGAVFEQGARPLRHLPGQNRVVGLLPDRGDVRGLVEREVDVRVDEPGDHERAVVRVHSCPGPSRGQFLDCSDVADEAGIVDQERIRRRGAGGHIGDDGPGVDEVHLSELLVDADGRSGQSL